MLNRLKLLLVLVSAAGLAAGFLALFFGMATSAQAEESAFAKEQRLIEVNSMRCHAIGELGESPFIPAPPFLKSSILSHGS